MFLVWNFGKSPNSDYMLKWHGKNIVTIKVIIQVWNLSIHTFVWIKALDISSLLEQFWRSMSIDLVSIEIKE